MKHSSYRRLAAVLLCACLALAAVPCTAETAAALSFLTPSVFAGNFNDMMNALADGNAEQLGPDGVSMIKKNFTITRRDVQGTAAYYGSEDWRIETAFLFPDGTEPDDSKPARLMNFTIKAGTPETAAKFAAYTFMMMIGYEFSGDEALLENLRNWFDTVKDPQDVFRIPGYMVVALFTAEYTQYAVLPDQEAAPAGSPSARTKEEERKLLTLTVEGREYVLGESTPRDFEKYGWTVTREADGVFSVTQKDSDEVLYVASEGSSMDGPILTINAFWSLYCTEYCGFDGIPSPSLAEGEDPDQAWDRNYSYEELIDFENRPEGWYAWSAIGNWLTEELGAEISEEGIFEATVPLSDGRTLYISSHDSPVRISLVSLND